MDDGSNDGTYEAALRESEGWSRVKVLRHRRNLGKTEAMVTGADAAESEYVILFDADLQHSPEEFPRFLREALRGLGHRRRPEGGALREAHHQLGVQPRSRSASSRCPPGTSTP